MSLKSHAFKNQTPNFRVFLGENFVYQLDNLPRYSAPGDLARLLELELSYKSIRPIEQNKQKKFGPNFEYFGPFYDFFFLNK